MAAIGIIGALMLGGGTATTLHLFALLREAYPGKAVLNEVGKLCLMFFNAFVAAVGAAFMFANSPEEMQWHRTAIAFGVSVVVDFVFTWAIVLKPAPGKEPK